MTAHQTTNPIAVPNTSIATTAAQANAAAAINQELADRLGPLVTYVRPIRVAPSFAALDGANSNACV